MSADLSGRSRFDSSSFEALARPEPAPIRVLVSVSGGPNAPAALGMLPGLAVPGNEITYLHVRHPETARGPALAEALAAVRGLANVHAEEVVATDAFGVIAEASRDVDLVILGASPAPTPISNPKLRSLITRLACPTLVVRARRRTPHNSRDGRHALVVAEGAATNPRAIARAVRWASAGSTEQALLLGPGPRGLLPRIPDDLSCAHVVRTELAQGRLDAGRVLDVIDQDDHDLVVVVADDEDLRSGGAWLDDLFITSRRAVVAAVSPSNDFRTRRRERLVTSR